MILDRNRNFSEKEYSYNVRPSGVSICLILVMISIIFSGYMCIFDGSRNDAYAYMPLLPFSYAIITFFVINIFSKFLKSIVFTTLTLGYFIKMSLYPFLCSLGGFVSFFSGYAQISKLLIAIVYLIYEYAILMLICYLLLKGMDTSKNDLYVNGSIYKTRTIKLMMLVLCLFLIIAYNYVSELKSIYYLPTDISLDQLVGIRWNNEIIVARGSLKRYIYTLFMFLWPIVRFLLPATLISGVYIKYGRSRLGVWVSGLCCLIPFVFLGGDNFAPFLAATISLIIIRRLYGSLSDRMFTLVIGCGILLLLGFISSKLLAMTNWRGATGVSNIAQLLNGYFPGVENMALTMQINASGKLSTLFFDIYSGIPFAGTLFGLSGDSFNDIFNAYSNTGGQIVPFGGNIGYYSSFILSPLIFGMIIGIAIKYEKRAKDATEYWRYYVYMLFSTYTVISTIIYSTQIYLRFILNIFIPILIIRWGTNMTIKKK